MDAFEINRLFGDQKHMKKYIKKDYIRVYDGRVQANHAKLTCHTLTDKLIDFSKGELILTGYVESTVNGTPIGAANDVGIQNGCYSVLSDIKISFNNNEVEHNREPLFTTTYLNYLEYSPDYNESLSKQHGFESENADVVGGNNSYNNRNAIFRGGHANDRYVFTLTIALKDISQFFRRLNFPIMNQLFEIEFNINRAQCIFRGGGAPASAFYMTEVTLFVPEVVLPTKETQMLLKEINSGSFVKEIEWDATEIYTRNNQVAANTPFNELLGTNLTGVNKIIAVVLPQYDNQVHSQTRTNINITDFNIEIDSKDYFNMNIRTTQEAYRLLVDNFNMAGNDLNTGCLVPIDTWIDGLRIYTVDLSRQEVFEADPNATQQIRIRGTPSAAGTLRVFMFKNKKTQINYSHPELTRTIH